MRKWCTGLELISQFGLQGFEFFDLLRKGLQAYTYNGKKVIDSDPLPKGRKFSLEFFESTIRAKLKARVLGGPGTVIKPPPSESEIKREALFAYNRQSLDILDPPKNCFIFSFTLPDNDKERNRAILTALSFTFKSEDVLKYFDNDSLLVNGAIKGKREKLAKSEADNADNTVKPFLSKIGKKGGLHPKKIEPIMEAAKKFMLDDIKLIDMGLEKITKKFSNKFNEDKPMCVSIDGMKYEIFCQRGLIISRPGENYDGRKNKNQEKTIKYTTFMKNYIHDAKESILSQK